MKLFSLMSCFLFFLRSLCAVIWLPAEIISPPLEENFVAPEIVSDSEGTFYCVYFGNNAASEVYFTSHPTNGSWSTPILISDS